MNLESNLLGSKIIKKNKIISKDIAIEICPKYIQGWSCTPARIPSIKSRLQQFF